MSFGRIAIAPDTPSHRSVTRASPTPQVPTLSSSRVKRKMGQGWTGACYYRARYYDPVRSRFVREDPIGFLSGTTNLYSYPRENPINLIDPLGLAEFIGRGLASWYGPGFAGKPTASGQPFDPLAMSGASRDLPLGTKVEVQHNGKSVEVIINDRGPYHRDQDGQYDRIIDLSQGAFQRLADPKTGVIEVEIAKTGYEKVTRPRRSSNRVRGAQPVVKVRCPPDSPDPFHLLGPFAP